MSLENEIKELRIAIEALKEVIIMDVQGNLTPKPVIPVTSSDQEVTDPESVETAKPQTVTPDEIKTACLALSRSVENGKEKAKEILAQFDARKATDVKEGDRPKVLNLLQQTMV